MSATIDSSNSFVTGGSGYTFDGGEVEFVSPGIARLLIGWGGGTATIETPNINTATADWGPINRVRMTSQEFVDYYHLFLVSFDGGLIWKTYDGLGGWRPVLLDDIDPSGMSRAELERVREWPDGEDVTSLRFAISITSVNASGDFNSDTTRGHIDLIEIDWMASAAIIDLLFTLAGQSQTSMAAGPVPIVSGIPEENWVLTFISTTEATVVGSKSGTKANATMSSAYDNGVVGFTIPVPPNSVYTIGDTITFSTIRDRRVTSLQPEPRWGSCPLGSIIINNSAGVSGAVVSFLTTNISEASEIQTLTEGVEWDEQAANGDSEELTAEDLKDAINSGISGLIATRSGARITIDSDNDTELLGLTVVGGGMTADFVRENLQAVASVPVPNFSTVAGEAVSHPIHDPANARPVGSTGYAQWTMDYITAAGATDGKLAGADLVSSPEDVDLRAEPGSHKLHVSASNRVFLKVNNGNPTAATGEEFAWDVYDLRPDSASRRRVEWPSLHFRTSGGHEIATKLSTEAREIMDVSWSGMIEARRDALEAFIDRHLGSSFDWTPPLDSAARVWIVDGDASFRLVGKSAWEARAQFIEVK